MPEILYFAPPASLAGPPEIPVQPRATANATSSASTTTRSRSCAVRQRDELWVTPDTRAALVAPYLVAWRTKIERLGTMNFPQAAWRAPGTRNPDVEVVILADGTLAVRHHHAFERLGEARPGRRWTS